MDSKTSENNTPPPESPHEIESDPMITVKELNSVEESRKFGTFQGVFRPTILTILGVMMYLREGWVVGNAGLGGTILIILSIYFITGASALSISSITTNIRLGSGGVFSIVSQSLGLEMGGSIGIPFFLAQGISTAMYIYGFMEGWRYLFPSHPSSLVIICVFATVFVLSFVSTNFAFYVQNFVMLGVIFALSSIFLGIYKLPTLQTPELWGSFQDADYWLLFAIFFPSATGIMVGASMSGNLRKPQQSIPRGTLYAWVVSLMVYVSLAIWYSLVATPEELRADLTIAADRAYWGDAVLIGILSSCFTAALSSFVAAPRILQSLGTHRIVPYAKFFGKLHNGEPRNAMIFTGCLVTITLILGDLNMIAQVLTIFFLLTYFTINSVLLIESRLNLISFRPTFRTSWKVSFLGALASLTAIIVISPFWGLISILLSITIYFFLNRIGMEDPWDTVRSGLWYTLANWSAKRVAFSGEKASPRAWKPDLLMPLEKRTVFDGHFRLLRSITYPQGSIRAIGLMKDRDILPLLGLQQVINEMRHEGIFANSAIIDANEYLSGLDTTIAVLKGSFFQSNIIFLPLEGRTQAEVQGTLDIARNNDLGVLFYMPHPEVGLGRERTINLWIRDQSPGWHLSIKSNIDLSLLTSYKLLKNWDATLKVTCLVSNPENRTIAKEHLQNLMLTARMPKRYEIDVEEGHFMDYLERAPRVDLNIFGVAEVVNLDDFKKIMMNTKSSCIFVRNSGLESALA